jgi:hypothetical protein
MSKDDKQSNTRKFNNYIKFMNNVEKYNDSNRK